MIYSGADWRPIDVNYETGGIRPRLLVIHIMEGTLGGTDGWFRNERAQVSAHFGAGRDGSLYQWVSTSNRAWHAAGANDYALGVECEGDIETGEDTLTEAQLNTVAKLYGWCHRHYPEISLWLNRRPYNGSGLAWHGLGGPTWGNHPDCPGVKIRAQLPEILHRARALAKPAA